MNHPAMTVQTIYMIWLTGLADINYKHC